MELAWRSGSIMDCHATAQGLIPLERCIYRASLPPQGTVNGGAVSKWPRRWRDVKHKQTNKYNCFSIVGVYCCFDIWGHIDTVPTWYLNQCAVTPGETEFMNSWTFMNHSWTVHELFMNWEEKFLKKFMNFWFMNSSWTVHETYVHEHRKVHEVSMVHELLSKLPSIQSGNMASILLAKIYPSW